MSVYLVLFLRHIPPLLLVSNYLPIHGFIYDLLSYIFALNCVYLCLIACLHDLCLSYTILRCCTSSCTCCRVQSWTCLGADLTSPFKAIAFGRWSIVKWVTWMGLLKCTVSCPWLPSIGQQCPNHRKDINMDQAVNINVNILFIGIHPHKYRPICTSWRNTFKIM
jgi:hypothetical protein